MYGDCQVMSNMGSGGNGAIHPSSSDSFFPSQIQNPNFNFMSNMPPFTHVYPSFIPKELDSVPLTLKRGKEEMESGSGGSEQIEGGLSGNEQDTAAQQPPSKKKRYHRHTAHQIQEMESLFRECPHPDDKQRMKLSQDLGLKPRQVKFWFQNRRTQMKAQQDRADNSVLRSENDNLKSENYRLQAALRNIMCPDCGGPAMLGDMNFDAQQLRIENARLKEEFEKVCAIVSRYGGRSMQAAIGSAAPSLLSPSLELDMSFYPRPFDHQDSLGNCTSMFPVPLMPENSSHNFPGAGGLVIMDQEKALALDLALSSVDELVKMCQAGEPLWIQTSQGNEVLNVEEYNKMFPWPMSLGQLPSDQQLKIEASRHTAVVIINSITLVDAFLDADKWVEMFPSIISRARTLQVVASGASGNANGSLHLMFAEMQVPSPLVPTREAHFLRYCHQNVEEGTWVIVDFPLDNLQDYSYPPSFPIYRRRPSGCIIQDMPNGYSRVTWVEHVEVEDKPVHQIFNQFVNSGLAFGAQRWLAVLQRQCERLASLMARNISDLGVISSPEARTNLMNLAQRMLRTFCVSLSSSSGQSWTALSDCPEDTIRITTTKATEPGHPSGLILSAVSTTWLPYPHYQVFDLLRDERSRAQMEVLSNGYSLNEVAHIANGSHPGNCISLLRINVASNSSQTVEFMLQESCTDESGSLVAYTTLDVDAVQLAMNGEDPSCIPILPLGFVIVPMNQNNSITTQDHGCLLTIGLQVLASTVPNAKLNLSSVTAINNHICNTIDQINSALSGASTSGCHDSSGLICGRSSTESPSGTQKKESGSTSRESQ